MHYSKGDPSEYHTIVFLIHQQMDNLRTPDNTPKKTLLRREFDDFVSDETPGIFWKNNTGWSLSKWNLRLSSPQRKNTFIYTFTVTH